MLWYNTLNSGTIFINLWHISHECGKTMMTETKPVKSLPGDDTHE